MLEDRTKRKKR